MDFHDTLADWLPAPRDDDPPSLRQDILDELGDHLASAYRRELLRGVDSSVARELALERFGDPAAVARRLWFDAMRAKIMVQRMLIAACLVLTVTSVALVGLVWIQSSRVAAEATEANRRFAEALAHAQSTNKDMLIKLSEMSDVVRNTSSLDWNPVTFKVTEGTKEGHPVVGVEISLNPQPNSFRSGNGQVGGSGQNPVKPAWRVTDASGIADFGVVHPGDYSYRLYRTSGQVILSSSGEVSIEPGSRANEQIVCPAPVERVPVRVRAAWPADLEKEKLVLYALFVHRPIQLGGRAWTLSDGQPGGPNAPGRVVRHGPMAWPAGRAVLCGPNSSMTEILPTKSVTFWTLPPAQPEMVPGPQQTIWADVLNSDLRVIEEPLALEWERGSYGLSGVVVLRPTPRRWRFEVVVVSSPQLHYQLLNKPPADNDRTSAGPRRKGFGSENGQGGGMASPNRAFGPDHSFSWDAWATRPALLEAQSDQVSEYTITLPDEMIKAVRTKLARPPATIPQELP